MGCVSLVVLKTFTFSLTDCVLNVNFVSQRSQATNQGFFVSNDRKTKSIVSLFEKHSKLGGYVWIFFYYVLVLFIFLHFFSLSIDTVKIIYSTKVPDRNALNEVMMKLFGRTAAVAADLFGMAMFLEKSYLHDSLHPLLDLVFKHVKLIKNGEVNFEVEVNCVGIATMLTLLCPQEVTGVALDAKSNEYLSKIGKTEEEEQGSDDEKKLFIFKQVSFKATSDPKQPFKKERNFLGDYQVDELYPFCTNHWISIENRCILPWLYLCQPCGFVLKGNVDEDNVLVYIYTSLTTNTNQRRLTDTEDRLYQTIRTLSSPTDQTTDVGATVDGTMLMVHPFEIKEVHERKKGHLNLFSPLSSCLPDSELGYPSFCGSKYTAGLLPFEKKLLELLQYACGVNVGTGLDSVFDDSSLPPNMLKVKCPMLYGMLLYINVCDKVCSTYNCFSSRNDFVKLLCRLVTRIQEHGAFTFPTRHHVLSSNVAHISRLVFRYCFPDMGMMIIDGNCRNYSACCAYSRCRNWNRYLAEPMSIDSEDYLGEPNYEAISRLIACDFIMPPCNDIMLKSSTPYNNMEKGFQHASQVNYALCNSGRKLTCQQIAHSLFTTYVLDVVKEERHTTYFPIEIRSSWTADFKQASYNLQKKELELIKQKDDLEQNNWLNFASEYWLRSKIDNFYNHIMQTNPEFLGKFLIKLIQCQQNKRNPSLQVMIKYLGDNDKLLNRNFLNGGPFGTLITSMVQYLFLLVCESKAMSDVSGGELIETLSYMVGNNGCGHNNRKSCPGTTMELRNGWIDYDDMAKQTELGIINSNHVCYFLRLCGRNCVET